MHMCGCIADVCDRDQTHLTGVDSSLQFTCTDHGLSDLPTQYLRCITSVSAVNGYLGLIQYIGGWP